MSASDGKGGLAEELLDLLVLMIILFGFCGSHEAIFPNECQGEMRQVHNSHRNASGLVHSWNWEVSFTFWHDTGVFVCITFLDCCAQLCFLFAVASHLGQLWNKWSASEQETPAPALI